MTSPAFSQPFLRSKGDLISDPILSAAFRRLANDAYSRPRASDTMKWNDAGPRFPTVDTVHEMLTDDSIVALIYDLSTDNTISNITTGSSQQPKRDYQGENKGRLVGCAAARPWKGGWMREGAGTESGWEINALSVDGDEKYLRRGLSLQLLGALEGRLVQLSKAQLGQEEIKNGKGEVTLWVLAAECLNGTYWRKRGFHEVRRKTEGAGVWSCKTSFEMVVFRKHVEFEI